jgi:SAM-dependent methyltransferase
MSELAFDAALTGRGATLLDSDGDQAVLPVRRWSGPADADDAWLLDRCVGPTVDLGCGPGRLLVGLVRRGVPALGVDHSAVAQARCRARAVVMVRRDVFARLPGEGRWRHVLLADGNVGIGGDPARLLARAARLLAPGGTVLVETDAAAERDWRGTVRVRTAAGFGPTTPWARIGADVLGALAEPLGLAVVARRSGQRAFVALQR